VSTGEVTVTQTATEVIEVPLHLIKPSKHNPRKEFADLGELANSIRQNQMIENIQRRDLSPLEAAEGYAKPLKRYADVATVAAKVCNGVQQPLLVRPHPTVTGAYDLVAG